MSLPLETGIMPLCRERPYLRCWSPPFWTGLCKRSERPRPFMVVVLPDRLFAQVLSGGAASVLTPVTTTSVPFLSHIFSRTTIRLGTSNPAAEAVTNGPAPPVVISRTPQPPVPKAQVIEIPGVANSAPAKMLPPTLFILANGERLETRRYVLTASHLSVNIERRQRTLPLDMLDINATITANRERGIDLQIPTDRTEISLSF